MTTSLDRLKAYLICSNTAITLIEQSQIVCRCMIAKNLNKLFNYNKLGNKKYGNNR